MTTETVTNGAVIEQLATSTTPQAPTQAAETPSATPAQPAAAPTEAAAATAVEPAPAPTAELPKGDYPEDWREKAAKGDAKKLAKLSRYASPEAVADALISASDKIASAGLREPPPTDPEALARWRTDNGIPESYDKYDLTMADGVVIGEADKPMIEGFLKLAHNKNLPPEVVNEVTNWYYGEAHKAAQEFAVMEDKSRQEAEKTLIAEWGNNYTVERNRIGDFLKTYGMEGLQNFRGPDGVLFSNSPEAQRAIAALAREINPGATVVPGAANAAATIESEMATIAQKMGTVEYTSNKGMQDRYMELLTAKQKMDARR